MQEDRAQSNERWRDGEDAGALEWFHEYRPGALVWLRLEASYARTGLDGSNGGRLVSLVRGPRKVWA